MSKKIKKQNKEIKTKDLHKVTGGGGDISVKMDSFGGTSITQKSKGSSSSLGTVLSVLSGVTAAIVIVGAGITAYNKYQDYQLQRQKDAIQVSGPTNIHVIKSADVQASHTGAG